jgi:hypothetical protein
MLGLAPQLLLREVNEYLGTIKRSIVSKNTQDAGRSTALQRNIKGTLLIICLKKHVMLALIMTLEHHPITDIPRLSVVLSDCPCVLGRRDAIMLHQVQGQLLGAAVTTQPVWICAGYRPAIHRRFPSSWRHEGRPSNAADDG